MLIWNWTTVRNAVKARSFDNAFTILIRVFIIDSHSEPIIRVQFFRGLRQRRVDSTKRRRQAFLKFSLDRSRDR